MPAAMPSEGLPAPSGMHVVARLPALKVLWNMAVGAGSLLQALGMHLMHLACLRCADRAGLAALTVDWSNAAELALAL